MTTESSMHTFLSDEWHTAVHEIKADYTGNRVEQPGLVVNATITNVPFGDGTLELHSDSGPVLGWEPGHVDGADLGFEIEYHMARALVLDETFDALDQEVAGGALTITGDPGKLRAWWSSRIGNPGILELEQRVRRLTA